MPGCGWKSDGNKWRKYFDDMANIPYDMAKGNAVSSLAPRYSVAGTEIRPSAYWARRGEFC